MTSIKHLNFSITAYGVATCFGNADNSCAAIRAGLNGFQESLLELPVPGEMEPQNIVYCPASYVQGMEDYGRLLGLLIPSLEEAICNANLDHSQLNRTAFIFVLPSPDFRYVLDDVYQPNKQFNQGVHAYLLERIKNILNIPIDIQNTQFIDGGHSATFKAIYDCEQLFEAAHYERFIITSVDSLIEPSNIEYLMKDNRVSLATEPAGLIPGEAAATIVLDKNPVLSAGAIYQIAAVSYQHIADKQESDDTTELPSQVLNSNDFKVSECLNVIIQQYNLNGKFDLLTDLNGERERAKYWAQNLMQIQNVCDVSFKIHSIAECLGDICTSTGSVSIIKARHMLDKKYASSNSVLLANVSDNGNAGAVLLNKN